jgi:hypothetical protein
LAVRFANLLVEPPVRVAVEVEEREGVKDGAREGARTEPHVPTAPIEVARDTPPPRRPTSEKGGSRQFPDTRAFDTATTPTATVPTTLTQPAAPSRLTPLTGGAAAPTAGAGRAVDPEVFEEQQQQQTQEFLREASSVLRSLGMGDTNDYGYAEGGGEEGYGEEVEYYQRNEEKDMGEGSTTRGRVPEVGQQSQQPQQPQQPQQRQQNLSQLQQPQQQQQQQEQEQSPHQGQQTQQYLSEAAGILWSLGLRDTV